MRWLCFDIFWFFVCLKQFCCLISSWHKFSFLHKTDGLGNIAQFSELKVFKETCIYTEVWMQLAEGERREREAEKEYKLNILVWNI